MGACNLEELVMYIVLGGEKKKERKNNSFIGTQKSLPFIASAL